MDTVRDNARIYGATPLCEMRRVVVHGVLHLCGQKDKTPRANAQMHRKEDKYLKFWDEHPTRPGAGVRSVLSDETELSVAEVPFVEGDKLIENANRE